MRVIDILRAADARALEGVLYPGDDPLRRIANEVFEGINTTGVIG
jgi:hypothetical protein